jgi:SAM-dependent methyltransferase
MEEVVDREKEFFDAYWERTPLRRIEEPLSIPGLEVRGKRVLICSCGTGEDPVRAARAGAAEVHTFDISEVAVRKAREVAEHNGVEVDARVMDFHALEYPDDYFDVIYGLAILHHVDCARVGPEIHRCLKPGGAAFFSENSDRNPILRVARRLLFGRPGERQRRRFLFFTRAGTADEYPLTDGEIAAAAAPFGGAYRLTFSRFWFFQMLAYHGWRNGRFHRLMSGLDRFTVRLFPGLARYSFVQEVWLEKSATEAERA